MNENPYQPEEPAEDDALTILRRIETKIRDLESTFLTGWVVLFLFAVIFLLIADKQGWIPSGRWK